MSSSKSCVIMHDDDNSIKRVGSSSNMSIVMHGADHDKFRRHGYVSNSNSLPKDDKSYCDHAPSASKDGDGDDDDDGGYDFAPAA
ncbi:hypothetical protein DITRI_Ditri03aG0073900 [Diplodiscus trichospermus]